MRSKSLISLAVLVSCLSSVSAFACQKPNVNQFNYQYVHCLEEGLALFKPRGQPYGYMDQRGDVVIQPQFEEGKRFKEGLAAAKVNGKWGYIDKSGSFVIRPQYEFANDFYHGVAEVRKMGDNKLTKINKQGYEQGAGNSNPAISSRPTIIDPSSQSDLGRPHRQIYR